ncbi:MAG: crotonase/enoyl-CoA hydratase family protein [Acidobacteria bacterium]|nr:MAG: crotonase/enoyl-CoA hydratase family protein [Acidobacteriota bacterium]REK04262.1 MAG: crotonase/enoyl-CoA hydratase family protein [Acidobacteriota bacterium]
MSERMTIAVSGTGVADVRLNRPEKMNALDPEQFEAIVDAGRRVGEDPAVRCVVLSGEGRAFCAGLDFGSFQRMQSGGGASVSSSSTSNGSGLQQERSDEQPANLAQQTAWVWHTCPVPVIAAVHGVAFGGGLQVALGADIRIVAPDVRLSIRESHWGLIPDMAGPALLRDLMPLDVVKELTFTAREVGGEEAVRLGLATRVAEDPLAAAFDLAEEIAARSPDAIRAAKRLLNASRVQTARQTLELETALQVGLMGTPNQVEAVKANFEKRPPVFQPPAD